MKATAETAGDAEW